jgi:hypothetical protein
MAVEPFSSGADQSGTSGVGGYAAGTGPASSSAGGLNPALGRSSRDLASDSGPAAAPQDMLTAGADDADTTTGVDADARAGEGPAFERHDGRKNNAALDPDTRLGLRPTVDRAQ